MSLSLWIGILIGILAFSLRYGFTVWREVRLDAQAKQHEQAMHGPRPFFFKDGQAFWPSLDEEPGVPPTPETPETPRMEDVEFHNPYEPEEDA